MMVKASELQLGDVVKVFDSAFGSATVKQIADGKVHFFRPYVHTADFAYTGGVMCYVGIEEWYAFATDGHAYELLDRKELR
jgi:hypothetical protein